MISKLLEEISSVMVGKEEVSKLCLTAMLAGGHVLIEDMPGTGKTVLAKTIAGALDTAFSRIQFTPDLLPSDITGLHVFRPDSGIFELKKGPVFANIILADEINRATPRTQAALLECMEEHQVTLDGETIGLSEPFFVIATQNPVETAGTFALPEAELDRFYMKLSMGELSLESELLMLDRFENSQPLEAVRAVCNTADILEIRKEVRNIYIHPAIKEYIAGIVRATRNQQKVYMGASPRATLVLAACAKAFACIQGRSYVVPEDIKLLAIPVLSHRLIVSSELKRNGGSSNVIRKILETIEVPTEDWSR